MSWRKGATPKYKPWRAARFKALERDGWHCVQCGKYGRLEVDHTIPLEDGGDLYDAANLQTLCRDCHIRKSKGERSVKVDSPDVRAWKRKLADSLPHVVKLKEETTIYGEDID